MTRPSEPDVATDRRRLRQMAVGFGVGSILFGLGTVLVRAGAGNVPVNATFVAGAVCFTLAAFVQLLAAFAHLGGNTWTRDPDCVASIVQFLGTLCFNVMTIRALLLSIGRFAGDPEVIWRADVVGSTLFLISSWIAWHPLAREHRHQHLPRRSAWICLANMIGSIFFAISAWGALTEPSGALRSLFWSNMGTFLGAIGFLAASVLLWPGSDPVVPVLEPGHDSSKR